MLHCWQSWLTRISFFDISNFFIFLSVVLVSCAYNLVFVKTFDCFLHDLLVAKLEVSGLDTKTLKLMLSYLSGHIQCVKIRKNFSLLKLILSDIAQESILGLILFSIFMNDIFFLLGCDLHNFADDNTVISCKQNQHFLARLPL